MTSTLRVAVGLLVVGLAGSGLSQEIGQGTPAQGTPPGQGAKPAGAAPQAPLQLRTLGSATQADPFPAVNPANFTADSPSVAMVDGYLHVMLGYDPNRIWRVAGIQKTPVAGVSRVTVLISERVQNAKVLRAVFYTLPDGKHLIALDNSGLNPFGADPFAENRALLKTMANGPWRGSAAKDLMLVEFADLQCPHCKDVQPTMDRLVADFPKARVVYEDFPITEIHPYAGIAAAYGVCVAKKSNEAFFTYAQAVYDGQAALVAETYEATLKGAVAKAGLDPAAIAACAATDATKGEVNASVKLANQMGVEQTPMLSVNGRMLPLAGIPYETLKSLIVFQAGLDGVQGVGPAPSLALPPK